MSWVTIWLPVRLRWCVALCRTTHTHIYPPIYLTVLWVTIWLPVRPYIGKLRILEMLGICFSVLTKHLILPKLFIITILTMYKYI